MFNKKGITPLVATVLLVAFSIGLGALVMSWGQDYIEQKAEFVQGAQEVHSGCDAAHISVIRIGGQPQVCLGPKGIDVYIDNGPDVEITNVHARIAGSNGVETHADILAAPLAKAGGAKVTVPLQTAVGQILQLKLTPKVASGQTVVMCDQSAVVLERIPNC